MVDQVIMMGQIIMMDQVVSKDNGRFIYLFFFFIFIKLSSELPLFFLIKYSMEYANKVDIYIYMYYSAFVQS